ncbi:molybdopterin molybdotransferase MoeA [Geomonas sp. RF6]|uniref:molybdopterin molybdotransferase MoeA n=1 Tax=Geomonas sp. RF6 TaxID=2897342 RepID=UPI001E2C0EB0|nr:gephyrin-like molybdotransferase Glp [Geomonas sp. RF6]UFS69510.1 molybdopterin molybdotransferase MoeA [Geomonas sp. RF6]
MKSFEEARELVLDKIVPLGTERVQLLDAVGRVLAEDVTAPWPMPLCDNSAMDGFAVRSADCAPGVTLKVTDYIPAGATSEAAVTAGCAARIMTGAPIPPGADAVVPFEETSEGEGTVTLQKEVKKGAHLRFTGEDVGVGDTVLAAGTVLGPAQISMLASCAAALVPVYRIPRVAILSTGDELVELGTTPARGEILNSNTFAVAAAVRLAGGEPVILGIARDDHESHLSLLSEGLKADLLVTSAGVSAGDRDLVRDTLAELGVEEQFWKVAIRPGQPLAFGMKGTVPVFSLPGNPVSTMITFEEFVRPALLKMMGHTSVKRRTVRGILQEEVRKKAGRTAFIRARVSVEEGRFLARISGDQNTGILRTMVGSNALLILPEEGSLFPAGSEVSLHLLDPSLHLEP